MDFCNDVVKLIARIIGRLSPDLILLIKKKVNKGRKLRNKSMLFILDCDTHKDIECILKVLEDLHNVGIKPLLAVPGELLIQGQEVYKQVSLKGYKFINHGFKQHTFIDEKGRYVSNYFYEKINKVERQNDILGGHRGNIAESAGRFSHPPFWNLLQCQKFERTLQNIKKFKLHVLELYNAYSLDCER